MTKVLVYDNEGGYYDLLKNSVKGNGINFRKYNSDEIDDDCDAVVFFLNDKLEMMDFVRLCKDGSPIIFGAPFYDDDKDIDASDEKIFYVNLRRHRKEISKNLKTLFASHIL
ncbi:MAG: hypothetical protein EOO45_26660 [Flavobacterium sp.]|nr:MAG: hypothetical protein EOO45_26660 [Flavobacterium sp.]